MEVLALLIIFLVSAFLGKIITAIISTAKATVRTVTDDGNFLENIKDEYEGMKAFEARAVPVKYQLGDREVDAFDIEIRGLLGMQYQVDALLVTSLFDFTDGTNDGVISVLDFMREGSTEAYQNIVDLGFLKPDQGFKRWVKAATVYPETITATRSGARKLKAVVRVMRKADLPQISWGIHNNSATIFALGQVEFYVHLGTKGYVEAAEEYDSAKALSVEIAVAVATLDGPLNPKEASVIQEWMRHHINQYSRDRQEKLKDRLNNAFKRAFERANAKNLNLDALISDLSKLGLRASNQLLLELLVKVISADNEVTPDEMGMIKNIGSRLGVDIDEIKAMADKAFLDMHVSAVDDSLEGILGIAPDWTKDQILAHLRKEFAKWNGRIQALENEQEKKKAQQMLDAIASARKKYNSAS